jgi:dihydroorotate dehydrogenase
MMEAWYGSPRRSFRPVEAFGLRFPNTVGLAAGFDKNARAWPAAAALGFGHVEIGTVTALAQPGNPRPQDVPLPGREAVINRLGFNNEGAEAVAARLSRQPPPGRRRIPLGVNLGKSKVAEIDRRPRTTWRASRWLADHADYIVLNVSSPNTPGLRQLQDESAPEGASRGGDRGEQRSRRVARRQAGARSCSRSPRTSGTPR